MVRDGRGVKDDDDRRRCERDDIMEIVVGDDDIDDDTFTASGVVYTLSTNSASSNAHKKPRLYTQSNQSLAPTSSHRFPGTTTTTTLATVLSLLILLPSSLPTCWASKHEQRLIRHLTKNYNPEIRPVKNLNETTEVAFEAEMIQLISVKERDQVNKAK